MLKKISIGFSFIFIISVFLLVGNDYQELHQEGMVVLLYHKILKDSTDANKYVLNSRKFEEQLSYLRANGYRSLLPKDISNPGLNEDSDKVVMLTFDDGTEDHYALVFPLLKKYEMKGVFFVVAKYINSPGCLTDSQIKEMEEKGMEFGSHSYSHPLLDALDKQKIHFELMKSKQELESICGKVIISFAPPGGWYNEDVVNCAKNLGYQQLYGCEIGTNDPQKYPFIYKRIEVLGDVSLNDFKNLLDPPEILSYKVVQSVKFLLHDLIGSENYRKLAN